jgi:transcriptional regulator with XRE-family HTH domain
VKGNKLRTVLSKNIKEFRSHREMSQADLAEKAEISITFLGAIERGEKWPHPDTFAKIAEALSIEAHELLKQENEVSEDVKKIISDLSVNMTKIVNESIERLNKTTTKR